MFGPILPLPGSLFRHVLASLRAYFGFSFTLYPTTATSKIVRNTLCFVWFFDIAQYADLLLRGCTLHGSSTSSTPMRKHRYAKIARNTLCLAQFCLSQGSLFRHVVASLRAYFGFSSTLYPTTATSKNVICQNYVLFCTEIGAKMQYFFIYFSSIRNEPN